MISLSTALGPVTLEETWSGYRKGRSAEAGPQVTKNYVMYGTSNWSKVDAVIDALMGTATLSGGVGGVISRIPPHQCPENPTLYCLDAQMVDGVELDARDRGQPQFASATIQASYSLPRYAINPFDDPGNNVGFPNSESPGQPYTYAIQELDIDEEAIKLPNTAYRFAGFYGDPQLPIHEPVARFVGRADLVFVRKKVPYLNVPLYLAKLNRLNDRVMFGAAVGTLRFAKARTRTEFNDDASRTKEVTMTFKWREYDWNKAHRPDKRAWDFVEDAATGDYPYDYDDLRPLLA